MNIVFLDYDGVVNTPMWSPDGKHCKYNLPNDGKVNNFQAVQWVSEFCQKYNYDIVVTSTWRLGDPKYADYLKNAGLRDGIKILGKTPSIRKEPHSIRGDEIKAYLKEHPEIKNFLIFDDDSDMGSLIDHLVKCDCFVGFTEREFIKAEKMHEKFMETSTTRPIKK